MRLILVALVASAGLVALGVALMLSGPSDAPADPIEAGNLPENFGIIVNPPSQETSVADLDALYAMSASIGSTRSNVYVFWNLLEQEPGKYTWDLTDTIMSLHAKHGLDATVFFSLVNGKTLGPLPDWMGHPTLGAVRADEVSSAVGAISARYPEIVDSVIIAGDADAYFESNPDMLDAYGTLFESVRADLAISNPDVKIGNAFSLDRVLNRGTQNIVDNVPKGDFVAFTYRPVNILNEISKDADRARADLEEMSRIAAGTPVALFEVGWSTSADVYGTPEDQAAFAQELVDFADEVDVEFVTWYRLHDRPEGTCKVETTPDTGILITDSGAYSATNLGSYVCSAGILDADGAKKAGWHALASQ